MRRAARLGELDLAMPLGIAGTLVIVARGVAGGTGDTFAKKR